MKYIPVGTCFSIPLEEGFGFGYINFSKERGYIYANIWDFTSPTNTPKDVRSAFDSPLLITDWLISHACFSRTKIRDDRFPNWKLHRNIVFEHPQPMIEPYVVTQNLKMQTIVMNLETGEQVRLATEEDMHLIPYSRIKHRTYYFAYVRFKYAKLKFVDIEYNHEKDCYDLVDQRSGLPNPTHREFPVPGKTYSKKVTTINALRLNETT